ncbi:conjugal transfer protein TrbH [Pseudomonas sp.]
MSYVAPELTGSDAQVLAADSMAYLADPLPPARTTLILDPPLSGQNDALSALFELSFRGRGYGVLVVDPKTGLAAGQGTPLRYLASSFESGVVLRLQFQGSEATRFYPRSTGGKLLSNGAPFMVRGGK